MDEPIFRDVIEREYGFNESPLTRSSNLVKLRAPLPSTHTCRRRLPQECPTADKCEKGGRLMSDRFFPFRKEAEIYFRSCENLLSAATAPPPFSQQELAMIGHSVAEVQKILAVSAKK